VTVPLRSVARCASADRQRSSTPASAWSCSPLLQGVATVARAQLAQPTGDAAYLDQARRVAPLIVPERGDDEVPVDFRTCRSRSSATGGRPVLLVHDVPAAA
jgi:hypothetical protein